MHRGDLQLAMANKCKELGVKLRLDSRSANVDFENATVELVSGEKIQGDVVLCTDGLWSKTREQFLGKPSPAVLTGDLAYRIVINAKDLTGPDAEELRKFITDSTVNFWVGPNTHVVAYTMRGGSLFNIVLLCPDDLPADVSRSSGDLEEMKALFANWDPILKKFLGQVKEVAKWKLMWLDGLPDWANASGTFLMAGDCCHPCCHISLRVQIHRLKMVLYSAPSSRTSARQTRRRNYQSSRRSIRSVGKSEERGLQGRLSSRDMTSILRMERSRLLGTSLWFRNWAKNCRASSLRDGRVR